MKSVLSSSRWLLALLVLSSLAITSELYADCGDEVRNASEQADELVDLPPLDPTPDVVEPAPPATSDALTVKMSESFGKLWTLARLEDELEIFATIGESPNFSDVDAILKAGMYLYPGFSFDFVNSYPESREKTYRIRAKMEDIIILIRSLQSVKLIMGWDEYQNLGTP